MSTPKTKWPERLWVEFDACSKIVIDASEKKIGHRGFCTVLRYKRDRGNDVARALNAIKDPVKTHKFHEYVGSVLRREGFKVQFKGGRFV